MKAENSSVTEKNISEVSASLDQAEDRAIRAEAEARQGDNPAKLMQSLINIESLRVRAVEDIWKVIQEVIKKIRSSLDVDPSGCLMLMDKLVNMVEDGARRDRIKKTVEALGKKVSKLALASNHDIAKLALVVGILTDKAQLVQGSPTSRVAFGTEKKVPLKERMSMYKQLMTGGDSKKPGRTRAGEEK